VYDNATIEVKLTSSRPFTAKTKPKSVEVGLDQGRHARGDEDRARQRRRPAAGADDAGASRAGTRPGDDRPGPAHPQRRSGAGRAGRQRYLLEWASFGSSGRTAEYRRIWFYGDGSFRQNFIDWNDVSGEIRNHSLTGTWTFKEGYTTDYGGGGVVVKIGFAFSNGQTGDDLIAFPNGNSTTVYVGVQGTLAYQRNPQISQNC
jgi:hypothetical protein